MLSCLKSLVVPIVFGSFPGGSVVKSMPANAGDVGSIPGLGRPLGEGNDNLLQYSCLENLIDKGAWWAIQSMGSQESDMTQWLNHHHHIVFGV